MIRRLLHLLASRVAHLSRDGDCVNDASTAPSTNYPGCYTYFLAQGKPRIFQDVPGRFKVGENVILNDAFIDLHAPISIGDDTFFGHGVRLLTGGHDVNTTGVTRQQTIVPRPIIIGQGVWIASFATILPGAEIGDHSVVGASSVVHGSVPPGVVVAGNPARIIKTLNLPDTKIGQPSNA